MKILVAYASVHGATRAISERIAERLTAAGYETEARPVQTVADPTGYDAVVIGSAAYFGHWQKVASAFVRRNRALLAERPVWLFSSGPLGTEAIDAEGQDVRAVAEPKEFAEFREAVQPRDCRVFFGALNPDGLGLCERLIRRLPSGRTLLPAGDFRDWPVIESWADAIARELSPASAGSR